jgi:hypothetical protein
MFREPEELVHEILLVLHKLSAPAFRVDDSLHFAAGVAVVNAKGLAPRAGVISLGRSFVLCLLLVHGFS